MIFPVTRPPGLGIRPSVQSLRLQKRLAVNLDLYKQQLREISAIQGRTPENSRR